MKHKLFNDDDDDDNGVQNGRCDDDDDYDNDNISAVEWIWMINCDCWFDTWHKSWCFSRMEWLRPC